MARTASRCSRVRAWLLPRLRGAGCAAGWGSALSRRAAAPAAEVHPLGAAAPHASRHAPLSPAGGGCRHLPLGGAPRLRHGQPAPPRCLPTPIAAPRACARCPPTRYHLCRRLPCSPAVLCYALLADLALNFLRSLISKQARERPSAAVQFVLNALLLAGPEQPLRCAGMRGQLWRWSPARPPAVQQHCHCPRPHPQPRWDAPPGRRCAVAGGWRVGRLGVGGRRGAARRRRRGGPGPPARRLPALPGPRGVPQAGRRPVGPLRAGRLPEVAPGCALGGGAPRAARLAAVAAPPGWAAGLLAGTRRAQPRYQHAHPPPPCIAWRVLCASLVLDGLLGAATLPCPRAASGAWRRWALWWPSPSPRCTPSEGPLRFRVCPHALSAMRAQAAVLVRLVLACQVSMASASPLAPAAGTARL